MSNNKSNNNQNSSQEEVKCSHCDGTGRIQPYGSLRREQCQKCNGRGSVSNICDGHNIINTRFLQQVGYFFMEFILSDTPHT